MVCRVCILLGKKRCHHAKALAAWRMLHTAYSGEGVNSNTATEKINGTVLFLSDLLKGRIGAKPIIHPSGQTKAIHTCGCPVPVL
jgi:hypothetical protein